MELSNEYIEDLFFQQMKEVTIRVNKQLRSFDVQFSGVALKRKQRESMRLKQKFLDEFKELDFYDENQIEQNLEDDEIESFEEGFMMGYLE